MSDLWSALAENAGTTDDLFGEDWKPDEQPTLCGYFVGAKLIRLNDSFSDTGYRDQVALTIETPAKQTLNVWANADLLNGLNARQAQSGDAILIRYLGDRDLGEGRRVKKYAVSVADENHNPRPAMMGNTSKALPRPGQDTPDQDATGTDSVGQGEMPNPPDAPF